MRSNIVPMYQAPRAVEMPQRSEGLTASVMATSDALERVPSVGSNSSVKKLLREIRTELRENNQLLKEMRAKNLLHQQETDGVVSGTHDAAAAGELV